MELRNRRVAMGLFLVLVLAVAPAACAEPADDAYIAGYATAVLERELRVSAQSLRVERGVITLDAGDLGDAARARITAALARIRGVVRVEVRTVGAPAAIAGAPRPPVPPVASRPAPGGANAMVVEEPQSGILPGGQLFKPLIADPRWPHFAAAYQRYLNEGDLRDVAAVSFGETFTLYRGRLGSGWWETGLQAGVFAVFDLDASSKDLINADYLVAAFSGYRLDRFSALARLFHQSSHVGDEFLLGNRVKNRVNLSYESVDVRLSYEFFGDALRLYGGGGYLFDQEPRHLDPGSLQWGVEVRSPWPGPGSAFRPLAGVDVQNREENHWHTDLSVRAGLEFQGVLASRNLQILLEYFRGHSPNGQFYKQKVDYLGLGAHFHF